MTDGRGAVNLHDLRPERMPERDGDAREPEPGYERGAELEPLRLKSGSMRLYPNQSPRPCD